MTEKRLSGEKIYQGRVFDVEVDQVQLDNGHTAARELVRHSGGVGVLAVDGQNRVVMVRQFRYGAGEELLELPAGKLERNEDPAQAGLRELREETGCRASECISLGHIIPTGAYCSERIYLYLARGLSWGEPDPDEDEMVEMKLVPLSEVWEDILHGRINDAKTVVAVCRGLSVMGLLPPLRKDSV